MSTSTKVEVAFATDPLDVPTWVDITSYVRQLDIGDGKGHELDRSQAGELTMRLDNTDRRFDPTNVAGPYYPNMLPMRKVRVTVTVAGTPYYPFVGYVEDWGQAWLPRPIANSGDYEVAVHAVDGFKILSMLSLTAFGTEVLADEPTFYVRLQDAAGATSPIFEGSAGDLGPWTTITPTFGAAGPFIGGATAADFNGVADELQVTSAETGILGAGAHDATIEAWVRPDSRPGGAGYAGIVHLGDTFAFMMDSAGHPLVRVSGGRYLPASAAIGLAGWHHVVVTKAGWDELRFYIDGVECTPPGHPSPFPAAATDDVTIGSGVFATDAFDGRIAHVAVYPTVLTPERIATHYSRVFDTFPAQLSGSHIDAVLDAVGWPSGDRTLDAGSSTIQACVPDGNALDWLLRVAEESEFGLLKMDAGDVLFHARQSLFTSPAHNTSQATFGDSGAENAYENITARYDDQDLYSDVEITREGGTLQRASDAAAGAAYGERTLSKTGLLVASDNDSYDTANYLLGRYSAPALRVDSLALRGSSDALRTLMYSLPAHWTRITVKRRPTGGGAVISQECLIERAQHTIIPPAHYETVWSLIPADTTGYWILGDATRGVLGSTTRLGW